MTKDNASTLPPWQYTVRRGRLESVPWNLTGTGQEIAADQAEAQPLDTTTLQRVGHAPPTKAGRCQIEVAGCVVGNEELDALAEEGRVPGSAVCGIVSSVSGDAGAGVGGGRQALEGTPVLVTKVLACRNCAACQRGLIFRCETAGRLGDNVPGGLASRIDVPIGAVVPISIPMAVPTATAEGMSSPAPAKADRETLWSLALLPGALGHIYTAMCLAGVAPGDTVCFIGPTSEANVGIALCTLRSANGVFLQEVTEQALHPRRHPEGQAEDKSDSEGRTHAMVLSSAEEAASAAFALVEAAHPRSPLRSISFLRQPSARAWAAAAPLLPRLTDELLLRFVPGTHPDLLTELHGWVVSGRLDLSRHIEAVEAVGLDQALASVARDATAKNFIYRP